MKDLTRFVPPGAGYLPVAIHAAYLPVTIDAMEGPFRTPKREEPPEGGSP
jgi:hypothetical protein